jgi:hypothetical protein
MVTVLNKGCCSSSCSVMNVVVDDFDKRYSNLQDFVPCKVYEMLVELVFHIASQRICSMWGIQKVMQHIYFLGQVLLDKHNILCATAFKCPTFMHIVARFPAG